MRFGKRIILINTVIIVLLTAVIVLAASLAGGRVLRTDLRNKLVDTVSSRAAVISGNRGVVPDDFDYNVGGVYLSVYLSDGTLKNGSFPCEVDLPIDLGVIGTLSSDGTQYYVYDFAVSLEGRDDIFLRGIVPASNGVWAIATAAVIAFAGILAAAAVILNILSVRRAVKPIDKMREEICEITATKDITRRLSKVTTDDGLAQLADDYNFMLDSLEGMFRNHERFTSDVAHELRTPLTVILSEAEYALQEAEDVSEKDASLSVILRQSARLKAITDSLLEFTRVAGRLSLQLVPVDLSALTKEFLADYRFTKGIVCEVEVGERIAAAADATLYERILQNLVDNAVKYGRENGHVRVTLGAEDGKAVLTVADDGIGMNSEEAAHAFDRFYRADKSRSDRSGLGLGLSFVKEIVRLFGGSVAVSSAVGKGTSVTVTLDMVPSDEV